jgi:hypothetical protein
VSVLRADLPKLLPALVTVVTAIITIVVFIAQSGQLSSLLGSMPGGSSDRERIETLRDQVRELESEVTAINQRLAEATERSSEPNGGLDPTIVAALEARTASNADAIEKFSGLLLTKPEQVITLPLMQRDVQAVREDLASVKGQVKDLSSLMTETAGQNRWVIGTLALGMLTLVVPVARSLLSSGGKKGAAET